MSLRILMIPMAWGRGWGPLMNLYGLATALERQGATIAFAANHKAAIFLSKRTHYKIFELPIPIQGEPAEGQLDYLASQGLDEAYLGRSIGAELSAVDSFLPDVIVSDLQLTSTITAAYRKIRHIGIARWTEHSDFKSPIFAQSN